MQDYDAIVIGAGQAGSPIAISLASEGRKVALIERDRVGGTCLNYGCRPTKALRKSAEVAHIARRAGEYGIHVGEVTVDFAGVMARKNRIIGEMQDSFEDYIRTVKNLTLIQGTGSLESRHGNSSMVRVNGQTLRSSEIYINTGARAFIPPIAGIEKIDYLTERGMLALEKLPEHLLVVGGGYIGLEFSQMFRRFGSHVTILESSPRLMPKQDEDVCSQVTGIFEREGIEILTNSRAVAVREADGEIKLKFQTGDGAEKEISGSHLLLATGRIPNSDSLNVDSIGLQTDERGYIPVDGQLRTNLPGVWALGDINRRGAFTHTAYQEFEILMAIRNGQHRSVDDRIMASVVFLDPPLGQVGLTEMEAKAAGINLLVGKLPMRQISRARLDSELDGIFKVLVNADTDKIVGATVLGAQGDDVVAIVGNFMATGASYQVMQEALPVHPTVGEFLPTLLGSLKPAV